MFFPPRRLRALFPLAVWSGAAFLFPHEPLWTGLIAGLGLMGATAVWFADRGSALDRWQQKHPGLAFRGVERFPRSADPFDGVCTAVAEASTALSEHRPVDSHGRVLLRRTQKELDGLLRLGANLAVQIEHLGALPEEARTAGVMSEVALARERMATLPAAASGLRNALMRSGPAATAPDVAPLAAVLTIERGLTAHSEALAELGSLERT